MTFSPNPNLNIKQWGKPLLLNFCDLIQTQGQYLNRSNMECVIHGLMLHPNGLSGWLYPLLLLPGNRGARQEWLAKQNCSPVSKVMRRCLCQEQGSRNAGCDTIQGRSHSAQTRICIIVCQGNPGLQSHPRIGTMLESN